MAEKELSQYQEISAIGAATKLAVLEGGRNAQAPADVLVAFVDDQIDASGLPVEVEALKAGQQTSAIYADTLADLQALVGTYEGQVDQTAQRSGGRGHSVHVIAEGGLDVEIAQAIYDAKAAGIDTHGAFAVPVTGALGLQTVVRFDRPVPVYVWIKAAITLLDPGEQAFPDAGLVDIEEGLAAFGGQLEIGDDVVWQSFFRAVYSVPGVAHANLTFATSTDPAIAPAPGAYQAANITIQPQQRAMFDASRVEVSNGS